MLSLMFRRHREMDVIWFSEATCGSMFELNVVKVLSSKTFQLLLTVSHYGLTFFNTALYCVIANSASQNSCSCSIFRFHPSSQLCHPSFSPLYDVLNHTAHTFSESLCQVLYTDAPVMTITKMHINTKTKTKTMTKAK